LSARVPRSDVASTHCALRCSLRAALFNTVSDPANKLPAVVAYPDVCIAGRTVDEYR
jgi:hypothetical protein